MLSADKMLDFDETRERGHSEQKRERKSVKFNDVNVFYKDE